MKILKLITGTLLVFALMVVPFSCANQKKENGLKKVTVAHWGHSKILIYLPLYVAMDGGFFKKNGLEVSIKYSGNDDQVYATVLSGSAEFGVGDPAFTVIAGERGGNGKIIATLVGGLANWGVAKPGKFNKITDYKELEGLRISSFPSPSTTFTILTEIIKQNNLQNTKIVETPFGNELALLQRDEVDLAIMLEPNTSVAVSQGNKVVFDLAKLYGPYLLTGVTSSDDYIYKNPDIVKKFYNSIDDAIKYCHTNIDSTITIAERNFPDVDSTVIINAVNRMINDNVIPMSAKIDSVAFKNLINTRIVAGDIKKDSSYTEYIYKKNSK